MLDLPEWLEEFTENLEDTEVSAPAHISFDSDSEHLTKVASRKHSLETHFAEDRNCEVCKRTKMTRAPCRRRIGEAGPRAEKFGDLITVDHRALNEGNESRHNHRYSIVVQDLPTQWIQSYPCKQKLLRKRREACKSSWSQIGSRKALTLTFHWNLANLMKIYHGLIVRRHHTDRKRMGLLREQCAEARKEHLQYCCKQVWMKIGGLILCNAIAIFEKFQTSWQFRKTL